MSLMRVFAGRTPARSFLTPRPQSASLRSMSQTRSTKSNVSHWQRTSTEPRDKEIHAATVSKVTTVNDRIKTFRFDINDKNGFNFLPGQWLDVFVPNVEKAGGFTITSVPREALAQSDAAHAPYVELAVQQSPENPPAAWLWQPEEDILGAQVKVRVGGRFVWPPPRIDVQKIRRVVFIAGGVGINPFMSMLSHLHQTDLGLEVRLLYSTKVPSRTTHPSEILFLPEMLHLFRIPRSETTRNRLELFFTGCCDGSGMGTADDDRIYPLLALTLPKIDADTEVPVTAWTHRIDAIALSSAVGNQEEAQSSLFYVCGPPDMTDAVVEWLKEQQDVVPERVLCEKWW